MFNWIDVEVRRQQREEYLRKLEAESLFEEIVISQEPNRRSKRLAWLSLGGRFAAWVRCSLERFAFATGLTSRTPCQDAASTEGTW